MEEVKQRGGYKNVSRWQKIAIESVLMYGGRQAAADHLDMPKKSLDDLMYRAFPCLCQASASSQLQSRTTCFAVSVHVP